MFNTIIIKNGKSDVFKDRDNHLYFVISPDGSKFEELHRLPCVRKPGDIGTSVIMREFVKGGMVVYAPDNYFVIEIPLRNFPWKDAEKSSLSQMVEIFKEVSPKTDTNYIIKNVIGKSMLADISFKIKECPVFNKYKGYMHPDTFRIGKDNPLYNYAQSLSSPVCPPIPFSMNFFRCNWNEEYWSWFFNVKVPETIMITLKNQPDFGEASIKMFGWEIFVNKDENGKFHLKSEFEANVSRFGNHKEPFYIL